MVCVLALLALAGVVWAAPAQQNNAFRVLILEARADLESLANLVLGEGVRPPTWTFNVNPDSQTYIADLWYDNEQLADTIYGVGIRPPGWIGATSPSAEIIARNVRHDLELAADTLFASRPENRPADWRGAPPLFRCSRTIQNLVRLLDLLYTIQLRTQPGILDYCGTLAVEITDELNSVMQRSTDINQQIPDLTLAVRGDLERLADEEFGVNSRPQEWRGNKDPATQTFLSDLFLDLDTLANARLGLGVRPEGWVGVLANSPALAYRTLRHDLELLADMLGRAPRPRGWQGADPLLVCALDVQNLVLLAQQAYALTLESIPAGAGFCGQAAAAANQITENPPALELAEAQAEEDSRFVGESDYAFTYLDPAATQYMGIMPGGTQFKAWYRNFGDSTMMFVSGDDFAVYVDLRWTTLDPTAFQRLPTTEGVKPLTFCDANWCNGPAPTPTPTGAGALEALLNAGTPQAAPTLADIRAEKTQVSWNNIRVTYLLDNPNTRTVQVALEICTDTTQTQCEPVTQVFDNATGAPKPVLSQYNGLNVYEFPYGYSSNLLIEGATLFSPDVWISDPTIR